MRSFRSLFKGQKTTYFLLVFFFIISLVGCVPVMKVVYGIKKAKIENAESIKLKALKFKLDTTNIIAVDYKYFTTIVNIQGIPNASIYDSKGNYIEYRDSTNACNAGVF